MEIKGYPDYLIYPDGKVEKINGLKKGIMKSRINKDGYLQIQLTNENSRPTFKIHRLIAIHYIPNPNNLPEVDHIDRDKTNNNISNLRWVTRSENEQNKGIISTNKTGIKNIGYYKNGWRYEKMIAGNKYQFNNKNKNIVLWAKFGHYILTN